MPMLIIVAVGKWPCLQPIRFIVVCNCTNIFAFNSMNDPTLLYALAFCDTVVLLLVILQGAVILFFGCRPFLVSGKAVAHFSRVSSPIRSLRSTVDHRIEIGSSRLKHWLQYVELCADAAVGSNAAHAATMLDIVLVV